MRLRTIGLIAILVLLLFVPWVGEGSEYKAQQAGKVRRIGFLSAPTLGPEVDGFRQGLREHGYVEGQNLLIEWRFAEGRHDRLPGFAADFVRLKVEAIVTVATSASLAAKKATAAIPIVFTLVSDPVASGLVPSLARPGGNLTGSTNLAAELTGKQLELLKEAVPSLKSVVMLTDPADPVSALNLKEAQTAARRLGLEARLAEVRHPGELEPTFATIAHERAPGVILVPGPFLFTHRIQIAELATKSRLPVAAQALGVQLQLLEAGSPNDFDGAFSAMSRKRADALIVLPSPMFYREHRRIVDLVAKNRLPAIYAFREAVEAGGLMAYGANIPDIFRRAATYVDKILKGTKPADLPVEQPTKFELVVNLKTAKALGLTIPQSVLIRADEVIQ